MRLNKLGRYELLRELGQGAMGVVYEGRDPNLDRRVAIKTVKVENLSPEAATEYEARFRTEARSAARLQHPNIVSVYDSDRDGDIAFLVMEYVQGDDLKQHLDRGVRYTLEQSLKMVRDLLAALDYAHKQGIIHRDVKPANLLIEPGGRVKLTDFGVARMLDSGEVTRTQGSMVGTLKYMAPEQVQGQKIDSRADLFSAGVLLYQLLTGRRPFDGENDFSIIHKIIGHEPPAPSSFNSQLPPAIDAVIARALAKNRDQRFTTARDFSTALQSAVRRAGDTAVLPPPDPDRAALGSGTNGSSASVTQELELVYWKDVKDSTDPQELEGFLLRFPQGIYADLARRRLARLGAEASGDQTLLYGTTVQAVPVAGPEAGAVCDPEPSAGPVAAAVAAAPAPETNPGTAMPLPSQPTRAVGEAAHRPGGGNAAAPAEAAAQRPGKPARWLVTGVTAAVVVAAGLLVLGRQDGAAAPQLAQAAPAPVGSTPVLQTVAAAVPVAAAPTPAAALVPVPAPPPAAPAEARPSPALASTVRASVRQPAASPPAPARKPASADNSKQKPLAPASSSSATVAQLTPDKPLEARSTEAAKPSGAGPTPPLETCKDRVFLAREYCLHTECAKPVFQTAPICVRRREEARQREEMNRMNNS